jgi:hypothetical protein
VALDDVHQVPEEGTPQLFPVGSLPPMPKRTTEASGVNSVEKLNTILIEPSFPLLTELFPITFGRGKASHSCEVSGVIPARVEGENQGHTPILPSYAVKLGDAIHVFRLSENAVCQDLSKD